MEYDDLIRQARAQLTLPAARPLLDLGGDEVQLSVRVPSGLRRAATETAAHRGETLTAFVAGVLERAVREDADAFAGLAVDLAAQTRIALAAAIADGSYAASTAEVDADEAASV